jgi:hypothetical protein
MKTIICLIMAILMFGGIVAMAQTNSVPPAALPDTTVQDIAKVLQDFGINISMSGIGQFVMLVFLGARLARKGVPDSLQTGFIGTILKHAALEVNPQATPPPVAAPAAKLPPPA